MIEKDKLYFIAEIGQNHQGDINIAKKMVDTLVGTGVSAIKTAKRDIDVCLSEEQKVMPYINDRSFGDTYYEHRKALELTHDEFKELKDYSEKKGFEFISSFTDEPSLDFLVNDCNLKYLKIASQRMADIPLLEAAAATGKPIIISTGMSEIEDIDKAMDVFKDNDKYLMQCTSSYPCKDSDINLNVINTFKARYGDRIKGLGLSGHHMSLAPDIAAYIMGATIIERHFTLDRTMRGTDHAGSLELDGVKRVIKYIRQTQLAMGTENKYVLDCERPALNKLRGDLNGKSLR
jgi:sialic acid synthase SpsE